MVENGFKYVEANGGLQSRWKNKSPCNELNI